MGSYSCCQTTGVETKKVTGLSRLLKLVSEESRLRLLCVLREGEHCVCELLEHVDFSQSLTSHHLKDLKDEGLIADEKRGLKVYYSLTPKGKKLSDILFGIMFKEILY